MNVEQASVGGQAVLEGVMMRSPRAMAVAVRRRSGEIVVREEPWVPLWAGAALTRLPVARGALVLVESLMNGLAALAFAAEQAEHVGEGPGPRGRSPWAVLVARPILAVAAATPGSARRAAPGSEGDRRSSLGPLLVSVALALGLFVGLPHLLAWAVTALVGGAWDVDSITFHALDGVFKLGIFVGYIGLIGRVPEIRRVFEFHGAEHKVVNAYERARPLDMEHVRLQGTFHARCGTSFVLLVLILSVAFFATVLPLVPPVSEVPALNHLALILLKVPLMAPLAGLAYEVNRWAARHPGAPGVGLVVAPGRWMQRLTVREPDDAQLEVALAAMKVALAAEARYAATREAPRRGATVSVHASLAELEATLAA